jgi:hypothetical protein
MDAVESTQEGFLCMVHSIFFGRLGVEDQQDDRKGGIHGRITSYSCMGGNNLHSAYASEKIQKKKNQMIILTAFNIEATA